VRLTAKDRILLHLADFATRANDARVPREMTRDGVARASWIDDRHVPQNIRPLIRQGLVLERTSHVQGGTRRQKVYSLTDSGRMAAVRLRESLKNETVQVRDATVVREMTISQLLMRIAGRGSLLAIARQLIETGTVDLASLAPAPGTETEITIPDAMRLEREYRWVEAAEAYRSAIASTSADDFFLLGRLHERHGYSLCRAGLQAADPGEFRRRMRKGLECCEKAIEAYEEADDLGSRARIRRCNATAAYIRFWLADTIDARKKEIAEASTEMGAALEALDRAGDGWGYGTTNNRLSLVPVLRHFTRWDAKSQEPALREAIQRGERAIRALSNFGDRRELATAYAMTAGALSLLSVHFAGVDGREELFRRVQDYWERATELSEEAALIEPFPSRSFWVGGSDKVLTMFEKALGYARRTRDRFLVGWMLRLLAYHKLWRSYAVEDLDEWRAILNSALEDAQNAKREFVSIGFADIAGGSFSVESAHAEYYSELASREMDPRRRHDLLEKAASAAREGVKGAEEKEFPDPIATAHWVCARVLADLVKVETNSEVKERLLTELLEHSSENIRIEEQGFPRIVFDLGEGWIQRAQAKSELADLAEAVDVRTGILREAVRCAETGLELFDKDPAAPGGRGDLYGLSSRDSQVGTYQSLCGEMFTRLYEFTGDRACLRRAGEVFERAAESYRRSDQPSRIAECHWRLGKIYDSLGDNLEAAEEFSLASRSYKEASGRIHQLRDFFQDLALYMQAWSEIQRARNHHRREEYGEAKEYYAKAAALHQYSKKWSFMAPDYAAWSELENAEDLSRADRDREAIAAFRRAIELFREAKVSLERALGDMHEPEETLMVDALIKAAERRRQYCGARIAVEEAKALERNGDYVSSSRRYGQAADGFEKLAAVAESDPDRKDLSLVATLAKAWEAMEKAEAEASPELYAEAARFFEAAQELSRSERGRALASGHSRFCKALEAGMKFEDTRDPALHTAATKHLKTAATYYARAGVDSASYYARASKLLFDAYAATDRVDQETDHERKAKVLLVVEKTLEASAAAFEKAGQPGKRDQALRVLENTRHERELVLSLSDVLHAPLTVSSTSALATPAPSYEQAVGVDGLAHADIRASVILGARKVAIGEDLDLRLELVNAGSAAGQLIEVEEFLPRDFELAARPDQYEVEDRSLKLKGKRLDPLKTERVGVVLKPVAQGVFTLRPRVIYLDESGNTKSYDSEPVEVNVTV
jgi:tetratricopeptide (TPR) repeat protein/DNA-binding MarR family transcriptional regulator